MHEDEDGVATAGSPVMPAVAYPLQILSCPYMVFLWMVGIWIAVMALTMQPLIAIAGFPVTYGIAVAFGYRNPYYPEVVAAWWDSRQWPRLRQRPSSAPYPFDGNRYVP